MVSTTETSQYAKIATWAQVTRAFLSDMIGWVIPIGIATAIFWLVPFVREIAALGMITFILGGLISIMVLIHDARHLSKYGYTEGLRKMNMRVIDPESDHVLYKARLYPKSILKLLMGRYQIIAIVH